MPMVEVASERTMPLFFMPDNKVSTDKSAACCGHGPKSVQASRIEKLAMSQNFIAPIEYSMAVLQPYEITKELLPL